MKGPRIEARAQLALRAQPLRCDSQGSNRTGKRLGRRCRAAIGLKRRLSGREWCIRAEVVDRLLARPALGVNASVHNHSTRPHDLVREVGKVTVWITVQAKITTEGFTVLRPA